MAKAAAKRAEAEAVRTRMDHLARFIAQMQPEEIWGLLDSLFPSLSENDKEDLYGLVIAKERETEGSRKPVNVLPETWRIRVGDWRALSRISDGQGENGPFRTTSGSPG
jgi:hypothetical protein